MYPVPQYPPLTQKDIADAQRAFDDAGLDHWQVSVTNGTHADPRDYFRAERVTPNGSHDVIHASAETLLRLAKDADSRLGSPKSLAAATGTADNTTY